VIFSCHFSYYFIIIEATSLLLLVKNTVVCW
jgi:hypothetical protein